MMRFEAGVTIAWNGGKYKHGEVKTNEYYFSRDMVGGKWFSISRPQDHEADEDDEDD